MHLLSCQERKYISFNTQFFNLGKPKVQMPQGLSVNTYGYFKLTAL